MQIHKFSVISQESEIQVPKSKIQTVLIDRYSHLTIHYWFGIQLNIGVKQSWLDFALDCHGFRS